MMITPLKDELMVQQQINNDPWSHFVAVIMLNQTGRKPVKTVFPIFIDRWPSPIEFLLAPEDEVCDVIRPLGMVNVRYQRLVRMTEDFITWDHTDAAHLYGIGKYGSDSYEIFFKKNYSVQPLDKELRRYLEEEIFLEAR